MRTITPILLTAILLYSCAIIPPGIEQRAADYYSFQVGHLPKAKYSSFLSPAYLAIADKIALATLDDGMRAVTKPSQRFERFKSSQVTVERDGIFALTTIDPSLGGTFRDGKPMRWVRDGKRWYIYLGSDAEIAKYGAFPPTLTPESIERRPETAPPVLNPGQTSAPPAESGGDEEPPAEGVMPPEQEGDDPAAPPNGGEDAPPAEEGEGEG